MVPSEVGFAEHVFEVDGEPDTILWNPWIGCVETFLRAKPRGEMVVRGGGVRRRGWDRRVTRTLRRDVFLRGCEAFPTLPERVPDFLFVFFGHAGGVSHGKKMW